MPDMLRSNYEVLKKVILHHTGTNNQMHPKLYSKDKIHNNRDIARPSILLSIFQVDLLIRTIH